MAWSLEAQTNGVSLGGTNVTVSKSVLTGVQADDILIFSGVMHTHANWTNPNAWDFTAMNLDPDLAGILGGIAFAFANEFPIKKDLFNYASGSQRLTGSESDVGSWTFQVDPAGADSVQGVRALRFRSTETVQWVGIFAEGVMAVTADPDPSFGVNMDAQADTSIATGFNATYNMLVYDELFATNRYDEFFGSVGSDLDPPTNPGTNLMQLSAFTRTMIGRWYEIPAGGPSVTVTGIAVPFLGTTVAGAVQVMNTGWAETAIPSPADTPSGGSIYVKRHATAKALPYELTTGDLRGIPWQDVYQDPNRAR